MSASVKLRDGERMLIDVIDLPLITGRSVYVGNHGYAVFSEFSVPVLVHRLIRTAPDACHVDHIDGDRLNNLRSNLRVVTPQANQVNRKRVNRNNTSGVRGVSWTRLSVRKPWRAQVMVNGRTIHLGLFASMDEAVAARIEAELRYFGEECPR